MFRLVDENVGLPVIAREFATLPISFKAGNEVRVRQLVLCCMVLTLLLCAQAKDLSLIMRKYREWAEELYPMGRFVDKLRVIEALGHTARARTYIQTLRLTNRPRTLECTRLFSKCMCIGL
jgi:hypothetical protein